VTSGRPLLLSTPPLVPGGAAVRREDEAVLARAVEEHTARAHPEGSVVVRDRSGSARRWTWAGGRANATLASALREATTDPPRLHDCWLRLRPDLEVGRLRAAIRRAREVPLPSPAVDPELVAGLRFAELLPPRLVEAVLAGRLGDPVGAEAALREATTLIVRTEG
jgi:ATP-dependent Lhr-like helicase